MAELTRLVLDVLKPHEPDAIALANAIAERLPQVRVSLKVVAVDQRTETTQVTIEGSALPFADIAAVLADLGATIHSVDGVEVIGAAWPGRGGA
ncbi:MAG: DUF211 domain-containing protein [Burkholderiales bacterium]|nr:MAG: DUF211 domain-containing protein [Burkholderiales bacterium]